MIQEIVDFCDNCFSPYEKGSSCDGFPLMTCENCLKEIHFRKDSTRQYDCKNMCYWYVCQDIYRYASEMAWLLHDKELGLRTRNSPLNICSIGCGPCSELIAIEEYRHRYGLTFEYSYIGFDINQVWQPIQQKVISLSASPGAIKIINGDVFKYYDNVKERPNMIILNYMLSDMLRNGQEAFSAFVDRLCSFVAGLPSCALLINDINRGVDEADPRYYYPRIKNQIVRKCGRDNVIDLHYHFVDSMKSFYPYGTQRAKSDILFTAPDRIVARYNTNTECHSAQMTIIKMKEHTK